MILPENSRMLLTTIFLESTCMKIIVLLELRNSRTALVHKYIQIDLHLDPRYEVFDTYVYTIIYDYFLDLKGFHLI